MDVCAEEMDAQKQKKPTTVDEKAKVVGKKGEKVGAVKRKPAVQESAVVTKTDVQPAASSGPSGTSQVLTVAYQCFCVCHSSLTISAENHPNFFVH